ncbi:hypothetical protein IID19_05365 [Patescibacteria group bacterium]|nr:hypothetical protein [Patescibacteria group bacterium]
MIQKTKNKLFYPVVIISFITIALLGSGFIFTEAQGSSSGSVTATVTINPLSLKLRNSPRSPIVAKDFSLRTTIDNTGSVDLINAEAEIFLPAGFKLVAGQDQTQLLGTLSGNRKKRANWNILAASSGDYIITVEVSATDSLSGQPVSQVASTLITVRDKPGNVVAAFLSFISNIFR